MSFFEIPKRATLSDRYLRIKSGEITKFVVLDEHPVVFGKHWYRDSSGKIMGITCPGVDICPICTRNKTVGKESNDYIPLQRRYLVNVLETTDVIKCPSCGATYRLEVLPENNTCTAKDESGNECGTSLEGIKPQALNEVKILERGPRLMRQLSSLGDNIHPTARKVLPLQKFEIMLMVTGYGSDMVITPIPQGEIEVDKASLELYDVTDGLKFTVEEITYLLNGGTYKDIFAARRAETSETTEEQDDIPF